MNNDHELTEKKECRRCGSCCQNGGPTLHKEDLHLLRGEHISHDHLITIRTGEPAYDPLSKETKPVEKELVKLAGRNSAWTCLFYDEENKKCSIYDYRPLECSLLKCWDTQELSEIIGQNTMARKDLISPSDPVLNLLAVQEEYCDYTTINSLVDKLQEQQEDKDLLNELTEVVRKDLVIRSYAQQQFAISLARELFLFGLPVFKVLAAYGFQVYEADQEIFLNTPSSWPILK